MVIAFLQKKKTILLNALKSVETQELFKPQN